jgi:GNAT superfamily N-acetyltransferase
MEPPSLATIEIRPALIDELPDCAEIWRESLNDYIVKLNQPPIPDDLARIIRLYRHLAESDPERFVVAVDRPPNPDGGPPREDDPAGHEPGRVVGFASAVMRGHLWFLSMCFIRPSHQGAGLGRRLVESILPPADSGAILATATDSAQPISNALYSRYGIVPRMPLLSMSGYITEPDTLPSLPAGISAVPFEEIVAGQPGGSGHRELGEAVGELDRELLGVEHPQDHRFLRLEGRHGFLYRDAGGTTQGYGYAWETGRIGPLAVRDRDLVGPVLGHLLQAVQSRGAQAVWVPGAAGTAVMTLLRAGLRFEDFPILIGWDRPFADFERYLPISPGLL